MDKEYYINEILRRLFKTGKIKKDEIWCVKDYITNLQEENLYLTDNLNKEMIKANRLLDNRDKAIEYIKHFEDIRAYYEDAENYWGYNYDDNFKTDLLNILEGVDKE